MTEEQAKELLDGLTFEDLLKVQALIVSLRQQTQPNNMTKREEHIP